MRASLPPAEFIPIAENTGLITELGSWLLSRVCEDLAELRAAGVEIPKVSVNLSPRELKEGPAITESITRTLERFGEKLLRHYVAVEMTKTVLYLLAGAVIVITLNLGAL